MISHRWIVSLALTPLLGLPAIAQSVISAHSGLIHFSDGSVFLDDQRVEQKTGKFDQMNNGSELRTQDGRVEVLLTPGTFLRMGANSAIRMVSNQLDDTRVELLSGSAVLNQGSDTLADTSVTILCNFDQVHIKKAGRYRFDTEPPQLKVESGEAEVREGFRVPRIGAIAGCFVRDGVITRGSKVRFLREGTIIWKGSITSLRRFKDDAREVASGFECGIGLSDYQDLKAGDIIETFEEREIPRTA